MDGKRKTILFTAAFFLLAFALLLCTLFMQLSLRGRLESLPLLSAQTLSDTVTETPTAAGTAQTRPHSTAPETQAAQPAVEQTVRHTPATTRTETKAARTTTEKSTRLADTLVVNTNSKKIHSPDCAYVRNMNPENRAEIPAEELSAYLSDGYAMCAHCEGYVQ